jgi:HlyD family secretion protein
MKSFILKSKNWIMSHKKTSASVLIIVLIGGYFVFSGKEEILATYVLASVEKGTIVSSINGSGQVEALSQVDLKARGTGEITHVAVKPGQEVRKGQILFNLNARDAQKAVRDAETALETAQLELEKFKQPPKSLDVQAIEANIANAEKSKIDADKNIKTAYRNLLNSSIVAISVYTHDTQPVPIISGTYTKDVEAIITINVYGTNNGAYFSASGNSKNDVLFSGTGIVSTTVPQPIGDSGLYVKFASTEFTLAEWKIILPNKSVSSYASNLKTYEDALASKEETIKNADLIIAQNKQKINDLYQPDTLELRSKELMVRQKEDALMDAKTNLSDYYVVAPFAGLISSVAIKAGDMASGTLGTIITQQKIAKISLNEVDIAKIKLGQKATITFDAIEDFSIVGEIVEIDAMGTVSQGVVNYNVKIAFNADSYKVKPGMSVSASIIVNMKQDVLMVPVSAIKTSTFGNYIEKFSVPLVLVPGLVGGTPSSLPPEQFSVEVGISNDEFIEIISGLKEGEQIVTRTITTSSSNKASTQAPSLIGGGVRTGTNSGFGGGNMISR